MSVTRPTRGAVRLDHLRFDPAPLLVDLAQFPETAWKAVGHGESWSHIQLILPGKGDAVIEHPLYGHCPAIRAFTAGFGARILDLSLSRLGPGGWEIGRAHV